MQTVYCHFSSLQQSLGSHLWEHKLNDAHIKLAQRRGKLILISTIRHLRLSLDLRKDRRETTDTDETNATVKQLLFLLKISPLRKDPQLPVHLYGLWELRPGLG